MLKALTAANVIVVDKSEGALELAKKCGADHTVLVDGAEAAKVKEIAGGAGCEAVIDFVGEGGAIESGISMLRRAGTYYVIGYGGTISAPAIDMISQEINFVGNLVGTYNDLDRVDDPHRPGPRCLGDAYLPADAVNDAMDDLEHGKLHGRGIFVPAA